MKLSNMEQDYQDLIESTIDGFICEMEEVAQNLGLPTNRQDIIELIGQALRRAV